VENPKESLSCSKASEAASTETVAMYQAVHGTSIVCWKIRFDYVLASRSMRRRFWADSQRQKAW